MSSLVNVDDVICKTLSVEGEKVTGGVIDVRSFGAVVDGGLTPGARSQKIQDVLDTAAGRTYKPKVRIPGDDSTPWILGRRGTTPEDPLVKSALEWRSGVDVIGDGPNRTVLQLAPGDYEPGGALFMVRALNVVNAKWSDMTIDGNKENVQGETQTHALQLEGDSDLLTVNRVQLRGAIGDGLRMIGTDSSHPVRRTDLSELIVRGNGRSGVSLQSYVQLMRLYRSWLSDTPNGGLFDVEPSGPGVESIDVCWNFLDHGFNDPAVTMSLSGGTTNSIRNRVAFNRVHGKVEGNGISGLDFLHNTIISTQPGARAVDFTAILDSVLAGGFYSSVGEYVVKIGARSGVLAKGVTVRDIDMLGDAGVLFEDTIGCDLIGCDIVRAGAQGGFGLSMNSIIGGMRDSRALRNRFVNWGEAIHLNANSSPMDGVELDNTYEDCTTAWQFEAPSAGRFGIIKLGPAQRMRNVPFASGLVAGDFALTGGMGYNGSGHATAPRAEFWSTVAPNGVITARVGSMCYQTDGTAPWFKTSGDGNTGWQMLLLDPP